MQCRKIVSSVSLVLIGSIALLTISASARIQVMDFNNLPIGNTYSSYTENGIKLTANDVNSTFDTVAGVGSTTGADFHQHSSPPPGGGVFGTSFTFSKGGAAFNLISIDIVGQFSTAAEYIASNGKKIDIIGNGVQTFGSDFTNITSFQQITTASGNGGAFTSIDDVTLGAPTPEPSTLAFLLTGSIGAALALRRSRRK